LTVDDHGGVAFSFVITESEQERLQRQDLERKRSAVPRLPKDREKQDSNAGPSSFTVWEIDYVRLSVRGKTL
jgi:hypothetical protein